MSIDIPLVTPQVDSVLDPEPHSPPAGDWHDDDGQALQSYFLRNDPVAVVSTLVRAIVNELAAPLGNKAAPEGNRLILRNYVIAAGQQSVYALPPDANRLHVQIRDSSGTGFYISDSSFTPTDDSGTASHQTPASFVGGTGQVAAITLDDYTGPLYISGKAGGGVASQIEIVAISAWV
jgi:hypothetical protein